MSPPQPFTFHKEAQSEANRVNTDFDPKVFVDYKDVTYQTFTEPKFRAVLDKHYGKDAIDRIFREYDAAPEEPPSDGLWLRRWLTDSLTHS